MENIKEQNKTSGNENYNVEDEKCIELLHEQKNMHCRRKELVDIKTWKQELSNETLTKNRIEK